MQDRRVHSLATRLSLQKQGATLYAAQVRTDRMERNHSSQNALVRPGKAVAEVCMKLSGFGFRSFSLLITADPC